MKPSGEVLQAAAIGIICLGYMVQWVQRFAQSRNGGTPERQVIKELRCLNRISQDIKTEVTTTRALLQFVTARDKAPTKE